MAPRTDIDSELLAQLQYRLHKSGHIFDDDLNLKKSPRQSNFLKSTALVDTVYGGAHDIASQQSESHAQYRATTREDLLLARPNNTVKFWHKPGRPYDLLSADEQRAQTKALASTMKDTFTKHDHYGVDRHSAPAVYKTKWAIGHAEFDTNDTHSQDDIGKQQNMSKLDNFLQYSAEYRKRRSRIDQTHVSNYKQASITSLSYTCPRPEDYAQRAQKPPESRHHFDLTTDSSPSVSEQHEKYQALATKLPKPTTVPLGASLQSCLFNGMVPGELAPPSRPPNDQISQRKKLEETLAKLKEERVKTVEKKRQLRQQENDVAALLNTHYHGKRRDERSNVVFL